MKSFKDRFNNLLLEEEELEDSALVVEQEGPEGGRRPQYDDEEDRAEFEGGLDDGVEGSDYDTEGLGEEVYSAVDDTTQEVIRWADDIAAFTKKMVDPQNPDALLTKLTSVTNIPEFESAAEQVAKHLQKAVSEIGSAKTQLDILATMSSSRRDARKAQDSAAAGASGVY